VKRAGVMTRGKWMPEAELKKMLDDIAPRLGGPAAEPGK
jgi:hypothetical protein